jgi:hypothetical protein
MAHSTQVNGKVTPSQQHSRAHLSGKSNTVDVQSLGQNTVQRALYAPGTLTPADVMALQRSMGNQAVQRILAGRVQPRKPLTPVGGPPSGGQIVQPKLAVGPASDKYEQEADRVAKQVVDMPAPVQRKDEERIADNRKSATQRNENIDINSHNIPVTQRLIRMGYPKDNAGGGIRRKPLIQRAGKGGFEVDSNFESSLKTSKGEGAPLADSLRADFEPKFGADFGGVKVHTDDHANQLNRSIQAKAFTSGSDIFFSKGQYNPGTSSGQQLLAHELTHTVQQGAATVQRDTLSPQGAANVQRDTQPPITLSNRTEADVLQRDIGFEFEAPDVFTAKSNTGALPRTGFQDAKDANKHFTAKTTTRIRKRDALLKNTDVEVQADDSPKIQGYSDMEVVTTHFPLNQVGRGRLDQAMTHLDTLVNAYPAFANKAGDIVPAIALDGVGGFETVMDKGMFGGPVHTAETAGQVTFGIRARNIGDIVSDLHGKSNESPEEKIDRDPGRLRMRPSAENNENEPTKLEASKEENTLVVAHTLAKETLQKYRNAVQGAPGGPELEGFLTIIFTYCESMQYKKSFLKNHTPLMAKTNMATLFSTLPGHVQTYYSHKRKGKSNLERLVAMAPDYADKMNRPLFDGVIGLHERIGESLHQWYHKLKLNDWLRAMVRRDRTFFEGLKEEGPKTRPGKDKLTTLAFPEIPQGREVEGYGALGTNMDSDVNNPSERLPVFELRSASKMLTYAEAHQWALDLFDYIRSLNDNPVGGHTLMK